MDHRASSFILTYHSIDESGSVISVAPAVFREQMRYLAECRVPVTSLDKVLQTPGAVAITFDDGFRNVAEHALPVLSSYGFPATIFVVTGYVGRRNDWPSQPSRRIPVLELMDARELREAARANIHIGAHTVNHPFLTQLPEPDIERELSVSRSAIEDLAGSEASAFAYPYGDTNGHVSKIASRHFKLACTTRLAPVRHGCARMDLPRIDAYYLQNRLWFQTFRSMFGQSYIGIRQLLRKIKAASSKG
jgi:peptidoglycan/xylan/chitin deacetylase (PgdA/CDA1 family)